MSLQANILSNLASSFVFLAHSGEQLTNNSLTIIYGISQTLQFLLSTSSPTDLPNLFELLSVTHQFTNQFIFGSNPHEYHHLLAFFISCIDPINQYLSRLVSIQNSVSTSTTHQQSSQQYSQSNAQINTSGEQTVEIVESDYFEEEDAEGSEVVEDVGHVEDVDQIDEEKTAESDEVETSPNLFTLLNESKKQKRKQKRNKTKAPIGKPNGKKPKTARQKQQLNFARKAYRAKVFNMLSLYSGFVCLEFFIIHFD